MSCVLLPNAVALPVTYYPLSSFSSYLYVTLGAAAGAKRSCMSIGGEHRYFFSLVFLPYAAAYKTIKLPDYKTNSFAFRHHHRPARSTGLPTFPQHHAAG